MLRHGTLLVLALVVSAQVVSSSENEAREKRQTFSSPTIAFPLGDNKATFFEFGGERLVQLTSIGGLTTSMQSIGGNDEVFCDIGTGIAGNTNEIQQCANISVGPTGFATDVFNDMGDRVIFRGPGELYVGPEMILFIADSASQISDIIENSRTGFVPVIPPLDLEVVSRVDQLVLNLDDQTASEDTAPANSNDVLQLLGSACREVPVGQSLVFSSNVVRVRQGLREISRDEDIDDLVSVLSQNIAGRRCDVLTRDVGSRVGFLAGPGFLCVGDSASDMDEMVAFFTNSSDIPRTIIDTVINQQLKCSEEGPSLVGNFTPNVDTVLVRLSEEEVITFPELIVWQKDAGGVQVSDRFDNVVATFMCPGSGVSLAVWNENIITVLGPDDVFGPLPAPLGGGTIVSNPDDCSVFAYPSALTGITNIINTCRDITMATPPPPIVFTTLTDGLGGTTIMADGVSILMSSTSLPFNVGAGQFVSYSENTVRIMEVGSTDPIDVIGRVIICRANTAFNRLVLAIGSANQAFSGPGTLFVDSDGIGFFTTVSAVSDLITNSDNVPPRTVDIVTRMDGNMTAISLQIGGIPFFDLPSQDNFMDIGIGEGVYFIDRVVRVDNAMVIPASTALMYFVSDGVLQVGDSNITMIQGFFVGDISGGNSMTISNDIMLPGGGILYVGGGAAFYWPSDRVPTFMTVLDFIDSLDFQAIMPVTGIETCTVYDGTRVQVFNRSALSLMPGPGMLSISGNTCFFTNNQNLIQRILEAFSRLLPPSTIYDSDTGTVFVVSNTGGPIANFSVSSRTLQAPGGLLIFSGGNITTSSAGNNFIAAGINTLTVFDGFRTTVINAPNAANFSGGGLLVIDEEAGTAFYTTSDPIANDIRGAIEDAMMTFSPPDIPDSEPDELTSKLNEINTGFGQLLTVYEGAEVNLQCDAGNANPPSTITFSTRSNSTEDDLRFTPVMNSSDTMIIVNGVNDITLNIPQIPLGEVEFRCEASNPLGTVSRTTRIRVLPQEPPEIDNSFFAGRASPGEQVVTARTDGNVFTITPIVAPTDPTLPTIDDPSQLTDRVSIGCKASGRPKPEITWWVSVGGGVSALVDTEGPDANITSLRQGQSVLTVQLESGDTSCFVYTCVAENGAGSAVGSAQVCPRRFDTEIGTAPIVSACSATCGIGVQRLDEAIVINFNDTTISGSTTADLPAGLVKPDVRFCLADIRMCPVITFQFEVGDFDNCSSFCDEGIQTRDVQCVMLLNGVANQTLNDSDCIMAGVVKPTDVVPCDSGPCPVYVDNGFGPCSSSCKGGMRMRDLQCLMPTMNDEGKFTFFPGIFVEIETCFNFSRIPVPVLVEDCNFNVPCPVRFSPGPFRECDEFNCQVRNVFCANFDPADPSEAWPANETECIDQGLIRISSVRSCNGRNCEFGDWNTTAASEGCSEECGPGTLKQEVVCVNVTDPDTGEIEDGFCDVGQRPSDEVPCFIRNCPGICVSEPYVCPFLRELRLCKVERLASMTQQCCLSCPVQASPIPPLVGSNEE